MELMDVLHLFGAIGKVGLLVILAFIATIVLQPASQQALNAIALFSTPVIFNLAELPFFFVAIDLVLDLFGL